MRPAREKPPLAGRVLLRLCPLGDRRGDVRADLYDLFAHRFAVQGRREARQRFNADVMSLWLRSPRSMTSGLRADVRDAARALWRTPVQSAALFLCLLLGATMTVAMFALVNTIVAGEVPGIEARDRLMRLTTVRTITAASGEKGIDLDPVNAAGYRELPASIPGISGIAFQLSAVAGTASLQGMPARVRGQFVNGGFFAALGTRPVIGRLIQAADGSPDAVPVAVLGFDLWQRHYGGSADAIGTTVGMGPHRFEVVGVAPRGFGGIYDLQVDDLGQGRSDAGDLWLPLQHASWGRDDLVARNECRNCIGGKVVLRLADRARPDAVAGHLGAGYALEPFRLTEEGTDGAELVGGVALLMTVPLVVLAIACTNVAGVQVSRALLRRHELATRVALGASRAQIARLIVLEMMLLAAAAGVASWFVTAQTLRWAQGLLPIEIVADARVFLFAVGVPVVAALVAGFVPSWRATGFRVLDGLQQGAGVGASARTSRTRRLVLSAQVALSVALLGVALHLVRGVAAVPAVVAPPQPDVLVAAMRLYDLDDMTAARAAGIRLELERRLRTLPGVEHVGFGEPLFANSNWGPRTDGLPHWVTRDWFEALGVRLLAGRLPDGYEPGTVVINETLAQRLGGMEASLGQSVRTLRYSSEERRNLAVLATVVGVLEDGYERVRGRRAIGYSTMLTGGHTFDGDTLYVKGPGAAAARTEVLDLLAELHPHLAPYEFGTVAELVEARFRGARLATDALAVMSVAALLLACVGLFGATSHAASSRVREFGLRLALGAQPAQVGRLVAREAVWISALGLSAGLFFATLVAVGARATVLETTAPFDIVPPVLVAGAVLSIVTVGAFAPARRVMAIDPVRSLRGE